MDGGGEGELVELAEERFKRGEWGERECNGKGERDGEDERGIVKTEGSDGWNFL